jgi:hypothetical protein
MKKMEEPEDQAEGLVDQWINGNRKKVLNCISNMSGMRSAIVSINVYLLLNECPTPMEGDKFYSALRGRLP